ncbi:hypothetical protein DFH07DRAFT_782545 [Mycena maculata]|uniref:Uncharacterized protein n=1 Tax=Mycena maculata TaxID=230809 RepID=A0AAD7HU00_9AGAR|nr:hypothetical protein DFH07DRAFT_782598 [Mycena maculata]KAJ7727115.1 hypothetical protein DFH07DRAFT_782545 [Mycena maculata]
MPLAVPVDTFRETEAIIVEDFAKSSTAGFALPFTFDANHPGPNAGRPVSTFAHHIAAQRLALVVLMVGFLGHPQPFLSLVDWRVVQSEVHASVLDPVQPSRSVVLHFTDMRPMGTVAHLTSGTDPCSLGVWVALEDQGAFWVFAYLLVKPLAHATEIAKDIRALITQMLNYFKADRGPEYPEGPAQLDRTIQADAMIQTNQTSDEAPPGYSGESLA